MTVPLVAESAHKQFIVDRPFIFVVVHNPTTAIVAMGKVNCIGDEKQ